MTQPSLVIKELEPRLGRLMDCFLQDLAHLLFHAPAMQTGARLERSFHAIINVAYDHLRHENSFIRISLILRISNYAIADRLMLALLENGRGGFGHLLRLKHQIYSNSDIKSPLLFGASRQVS